MADPTTPPTPAPAAPTDDPGDGGSPSFSIPIHVSSLKEVPEELHAQYVLLPDGRYEFRNARGLTTALEKERANHTAATKQASRLKKGLTALVGDGVNLEELDFEDTTAVQQLLDQITKKRATKQAPAGDDESASRQQYVQQALAEAEVAWKSKQAQLQAQNTELSKQYELLEANYKADILDNAIRQALMNEGLNTEGQDLLPSRIAQDLLVLKEGEKYVVRVKSLGADADAGLAYRLNAKGNPMTVAELVQKVKPNYPSLFTDPAPSPGTTGTGSVGAFRADSKGMVKLTRSQAADPAMYRKAREQGIGIVISDT